MGWFGSKSTEGLGIGLFEIAKGLTSETAQAVDAAFAHANPAVSGLILRYQAAQVWFYASLCIQEVSPAKPAPDAVMKLFRESAFADVALLTGASNDEGKLAKLWSELFDDAEDYETLSLRLLSAPGMGHLAGLKIARAWISPRATGVVREFMEDTRMLVALATSSGMANTKVKAHLKGWR